MRVRALVVVLLIPIALGPGREAHGADGLPDSASESFGAAVAQIQTAISTQRGPEGDGRADAMAAQLREMVAVQSGTYPELRWDETELHIIRRLDEFPGDESRPPAVTVRITYGGAPIVLVLCGHPPNGWILDNARGTKVLSILTESPSLPINGGWDVSTIPLQPPGFVNRGEHRAWQWVQILCGGLETDRARVVSDLRDITGMSPSTTQFVLGGEATIGPESADWRLQHILAKFDDVIREAADVNVGAQLANLTIPVIRHLGSDRSLVAELPYAAHATAARWSEAPVALDHIARDPATGAIYGAGPAGVFTLSGGTATPLATRGADGPAVVLGMAFDTKRRRLVALSRGSNGMRLLAYNADRRAWTALDAVPGRDANGITETARRVGEALRPHAPAHAGASDPTDWMQLAEALVSGWPPTRGARLGEQLAVTAAQLGDRATFAALAYDPYDDSLLTLAIDADGAATELVKINAGIFEGDSEIRYPSPLRISEPFAVEAGRVQLLSSDGKLVVAAVEQRQTDDGTVEFVPPLLHAIETEGGRVLSSRKVPAHCPAPDSYDQLDVTWDIGWTARTFDERLGRWSTWRTPRTEPSEPRVIKTRNALAVLVPERGHAGWLFSNCRWRAIPSAPIEGRRAVPLAFADGRIVLWRATEPQQVAILDRDTMRWQTIASATPESRDRCCPNVTTESGIVVWGGMEPVMPPDTVEEPGHGEDQEDAENPFGFPEGFLGERNSEPITADEILREAGALPRPARAPHQDDATEAASPCKPAGREHLLSPGLRSGAFLDASSQQWRPIAQAPIPYRYGMVWTRWGDRLVVLGGRGSRRCAIYDPESDTWQEMTDLPFDLACESAAAVVGDRLVVWSGRHDVRDVSGAQGALYDFASARWSTLPQAPIPPRVHAHAFTRGDRFFVWGGWSQGNDLPFDDGAVLDVSTSRWASLPRLGSYPPLATRPTD